MQHEPAFPDDKFKVAAGSPLPVRLALTPDSERPAILTGTDPVSVFLSCLEPPPLHPLPTCLRGGWRAAIYFLAPHRLRGSKFKERKGFPPLCLLAHPRLGVGGERSEPEGGGYIKWHPIFPKGAFLHLPFTTYHLPFLRGPFHHYRGPPPPVKRWKARF